MERDEVARRVEIMQAWLDGKQIEVLNDSTSQEWLPIDNPSWSWNAWDYRIKPTSVNYATEIAEIVEATYQLRENCSNEIFASLLFVAQVALEEAAMYARTTLFKGN